MNRENRIGPNIDPCGIPIVITVGFDVGIVLLTVIIAVLFVLFK